MAPEPWIRRWRSDGVRARHTVDGPGREWNGSLGCIPVSKGLESKYHIYIYTNSIILSYIILSCIVLYYIILYCIILYYIILSHIKLCYIIYDMILH